MLIKLEYVHQKRPSYVLGKWPLISATNTCLVLNQIMDSLDLLAVRIILISPMKSEEFYFL